MKFSLALVALAFTSIHARQLEDDTDANAAATSWPAYDADFEANWEDYAGSGIKIEYERCANQLSINNNGNDGNEGEDGDYEATGYRNRFVEVKLTDASGHSGYAIIALKTFVASQLGRIEEKIEPACNACPGFDVEGSNSENWQDGYCAGYTMESALGWDTWYANNCDEDCMEEQAVTTGSDQDNEEENENEDQEDEAEEEDGDGERRLRTTTRVLGSSSSSSSSPSTYFPGYYNTKDQFCANCMYDCDEDGDYAKVLNVWQYFASEDEECINTGIVSSTTNSNGEDLVYYIGVFCNGNNNEIKLGVFNDQYCTTPMNIEAGYIIGQMEDFSASNDGDSDATTSGTQVAVVSVPVILPWAIISEEIACDQDEDDDYDVPSYLAEADASTAQQNTDTLEYKFTETCNQLLQTSFGCMGEITGFWNENTQSACAFVEILKGCSASNWINSCTTTMIDLVGDTYLVDEGATIDIWAAQASGSNSSSSASKFQKTLLSCTIPLTVILGILSCYYHGKISGSGKGSVELSRQGGAMA